MWWFLARFPFNRTFPIPRLESEMAKRKISPEQFAVEGKWDWDETTSIALADENQFGRTFLFRAEAILRQVGEARTEIQEMAGAEKGKVVIGAIPTVTPYFLPPVLTSFTRQHP